ncbi:MAG TPA: TolC family protein [Gemmatimonadaceae bacterium]|nr:TolC family protein [Gemmatimonadaceae bacterium]
MNAYTSVPKGWSSALVAGVLGAAALLTPVAAQAQSATTPAATTGKPIGLQDAIGIALRQSVLVKQSENAVASSNTGVSAAKNAFLPSLALNTSSARSVGRSGTNSIGSSSSQSLSTGLSSQLVVFDGLRNVNDLRQAKLDVTANTSELTRARQTAVYTVASNYLTLATAEGQLEVQKQNLEAQEAQEAQLQKLVKAGARSISDLYQQQATTAAARAAVVSAEHEVQLAQVELIQTLQLDPRGSYDFAAPKVDDVSGSVPRYDLDSLLNRAFASRTDLAAEQTRVEAAAVGTKAAAASRLPTVSLTTNYNASYNSSAAAALGSQLDQNRGGSVSLGVSFPIFDKGATSTAVQQARIQEESARLGLAEQRQAVALDVRRAWLTLESTRQQLTVALAQQKAADLAVSTTQARYQVGTSTLLELTQARASQLQANVAVVNARNALAFQNALLPYYTGELDPAKALL